VTVLLFTTTDLRAHRGEDYERLLASVDAGAGTGVPIRHYVLLQNCGPDALTRHREAAPIYRRIEAVEGRLSLSAARNRLMAAASREEPAGYSDIVGFPDDDCWFPSGFLARLQCIFAARPALDLVVCRCAREPDTTTFDSSDLTPVSARAIVRLSSSNNIFLRGSLPGSVGGFDPALGLGTPAGGGEDTDYVIRAFLQSRETAFIDRALVGHPEPDRDSAAKYFHGAFIVLARHARSRPALTREFLRKVLVGLYFIGRGKLSPFTYGRALGDGLRAWRGTPALWG
jgi:hypothetical protein